MKTKKPNLDDFIGSGKADQHTSKTAKLKSSKPTEKQVKPKKVTYYIKNPDIIKRLKQIGLDTERDLSDLASEAIEDLVKKYNSKTA
ncbi:MAG: hypothetical protein GY931_14470 [Maribacter sp.]|nr:hypothetical protein [Maribacter sp.]